MAGLEGLRVLDMSSGIAGPFCARLLADSGADDYIAKPIVDHGQFVEQARALMEEAA